MAKTTKVKWSLSGEEPEELQDFLTNDDIEEKHGRPPRGNYTLALRRITVRDIKSGDNKGEDRLNLMLVIDEPPKSDKAKFNSWLVWDGMNVTKQGESFILRWLKSLGLTWNDFINKTKQNDEDPPQIVQIGSVRFGTEKPVRLRASLKTRNNNQTGDPEVVVGRYLPATDESDEDDDDDAVEEEDGVATFDEDSEADEPDEDESDDVDDDDEDEDPWTREDLEDEDLDEVKRVAKSDFGYKAKDLKQFKDVESLLDDMFPEDDEDDDDEDDDDEPDQDAIDELTEELKALKVAGLRKRALRNDEDADLGDGKKNTLIKVILEQELNVPPF